MSSKKALILYHSGSGNTQRMAKAIAETVRSRSTNVTVEDAKKFDRYRRKRAKFLPTWR